MDAATTLLPSSADAVNASPHRARDDLPQSPDGLPVAVVAQRRIMKADAVGSPVRRSQRLSCLPPPQPPVESQDRDESSDDESESVNYVALHLSRDETPENDDLPQDEPSTMLANRIIRAHDNPSPPPQDLAHPGINYVPGKDGQFPVPIPPSPFRPINLLERLNQFSDPSFDSLSCPRTPKLGVRLESGIIPPHGFISPESSPFITSMKRTQHEDLASADTIPSSPTQCTVDDLLSQLSCHSTTITSSLESELPSSRPTQAVDSSLNPAVPADSDVRPRRPLPRSERRQSVSKSSPHLPNTLSSPPSNENGKDSPGIETTSPGGQDNDEEGISSVDNNSPPILQGEQECQCRARSAKEVDANSLQRLYLLSPHSTDALVGLCLPPEPASSIEQTILPAEFIPIKDSSATPPRTPTPSVTHPDFSRTSVQRPVIAPTPVRANNARKLNSPGNFLLEVDYIYRTPAQRVPIETSLARGTSPFRRPGQLFTGSDQSRPGRFLTTRAPVLTRPVLDDPSRSPAKRIPISELVASSTRGNQVSSSPTRLDLRARSASVEPRPLGTILARSRSVEPCAMISKPDNHGKNKESIFPMVPVPPRAVTKLPFSLVSSQKSSSDLPPPIPEEHENTEMGDTETDATLRRATQSDTMSQMRHPSTNSRIPRIGNKPYARPLKNGRATVSTTTANAARAARAPPFQLACKNNGVGNGNAEVSSDQPANDQRLVGSLKRKRGAEATAPPKSHLVMIRQVVPGILSEKYAPKPAKSPSQLQAPPDSSPPKVPQPLKFRKVVDGMLSARYAPAKANLAQTELPDSASLPPSPLSELSSSSNEGSSDEKLIPTEHPHARPKSETSDTLRTDVDHLDASVVEPSTHQQSPLYQDIDGDEPSSRPRRTSRTRKPAQQQYVLDVFNGNTSTRPPPARRKPQSRTEGDCFMGMSATALKALTTSNTTKNQQSVAVLATEVIRKEGLRPESPTIKARTILQKQRDERDVRRRERAQRRSQTSEEGRDTEGQTELDDRVSPDAGADHDENDSAMPLKHRRGPGEEEDYQTPVRPAIIEPLRLDGVERKVKPVKQVKWHRGLSTVVYLDEVDPRPKSLANNIVVRGCLAPTSKNLSLDHLGNLVDMDNRPSPELVTEHIIVKKYLYDNDIEPEPIPAKMTRSKSKKSRS
ncbi:hypothetical protein OG21DRAFT_1594402 [Imleria badia]|nr:hypothetical protein OG21DRAFT_1594402 [Imleria badia]